MAEIPKKNLLANLISNIGSFGGKVIESVKEAIFGKEPEKPSPREITSIQEIQPEPERLQDVTGLGGELTTEMQKSMADTEAELRIQNNELIDDEEKLLDEYTVLYPMLDSRGKLLLKSMIDKIQRLKFENEQLKIASGIREPTDEEIIDMIHSYRPTKELLDTLYWNILNYKLENKIIDCNLIHKDTAEIRNFKIPLTQAYLAYYYQ